MKFPEVCDYVNFHDDICEGGGYLLWSQYVECQFDLGKKVSWTILRPLFSEQQKSQDDHSSMVDFSDRSYNRRNSVDAHVVCYDILHS